jgi:hypothetical protein
MTPVGGRVGATHSEVREETCEQEVGRACWQHVFLNHEPRRLYNPVCSAFA